MVKLDSIGSSLAFLNSQPRAKYNQVEVKVKRYFPIDTICMPTQPFS
jgi:hypothetical protein